MDLQVGREYLQVYLGEAYGGDYEAVQFLMREVNAVLKSIVQSGGSVVERKLDYDNGRFAVRITYSLPEGATLSEG